MDRNTMHFPLYISRRSKMGSIPSFSVQTFKPNGFGMNQGVRNYENYWLSQYSTFPKDLAALVSKYPLIVINRSPVSVYTSDFVAKLIKAIKLCPATQFWLIMYCPNFEDFIKDIIALPNVHITVTGCIDHFTPNDKITYLTMCNKYLDILPHCPNVDNPNILCQSCKKCLTEKAVMNKYDRRHF